jgi:hypothetical protein
MTTCSLFLLILLIPQYLLKLISLSNPQTSTLSRIYLSACDFPDMESSTFCNITNTPSDLTNSTSKHLTPYTDLFLSTKKKYKLVTKKVHPVIGELPA